MYTDWRIKMNIQSEFEEGKKEGKKRNEWFTRKKASACHTKFETMIWNRQLK